jgi:hypothetical protein
MKSAQTALDKGEWDFYQLPSEQVHLAFFYEYARSSAAMHNAFQQLCREMAQEPFKNNAWVCPNLLSQPLQNHHLLPVLYWLWHIASTKSKNGKIEFPENPWCELTRLVHFWWLSYNSAPDGYKMAGPSPICFMHVWADDLRGGDIGKMILGQAGIEYRFAEKVIKTEPHESILVLKVNWQATDPAIEQALKQFISRRRPEAFAHLAKPAPQAHRSFDGMKLPFRKANALRWLGVHRRREAVTTWREYFELYQPQALQGTKRDVVKSRDVNVLSRPLQEDHRKAKLILDWFENGTALKKENFK